ncbi:hypothetical protein GGTG_09167 [Gaeumannomyces tritici R3-111a-1]|uniref:Uncharacterized protein n=1 Tax=Gaeumannomyces tritici (strain R3-111a-1) TaxID=644352 RepID=J3P6M5_GAET3|nr:hypothetical protein GGTG_09167 [Gaeumannomyces tritici R3-111a-1]EJT72301.1 hypothetical protein GGTG_09167 [Gaeumannomyces tritici R3-111a-1]
MEDALTAADTESVAERSELSETPAGQPNIEHLLTTHFAKLAVAKMEEARKVADEGNMAAFYEHRAGGWLYFCHFKPCQGTLLVCPISGCDGKWPHHSGLPLQRHFLANHVPLSPEDHEELARAPPSIVTMQSWAWARAKIAAWSLLKHGADIRNFWHLLPPAEIAPDDVNWTPWQEDIESWLAWEKRISEAQGCSTMEGY